MTLTFNADEVRDAFRLAHPEIPADAQVRVGNRPGNGPGSYKTTKRNGPGIEPFIKVIFDLPEEEHTHEPESS